MHDGKNVYDYFQFSRLHLLRVHLSGGGVVLYVWILKYSFRSTFLVWQRYWLCCRRWKYDDYGGQPAVHTFTLCRQVPAFKMFNAGFNRETKHVRESWRIFWLMIIYRLLGFGFGFGIFFVSGWPERQIKECVVPNACWTDGLLPGNRIGGTLEEPASAKNLVSFIMGYFFLVCAVSRVDPSSSSDARLRFIGV